MLDCVLWTKRFVWLVCCGFWGGLCTSNRRPLLYFATLGVWSKLTDFSIKKNLFSHIVIFVLNLAALTLRNQHTRLYACCEDCTKDKYNSVNFGHNSWEDESNVHLSLQLELSGFWAMSWWIITQASIWGSEDLCSDSDCVTVDKTQSYAVGLKWIEQSTQAQTLLTG